MTAEGRYRYEPKPLQVMHQLEPIGISSTVRYPHGSEECAMAEWFVAKVSDMPDGDRRIVTAGAQEIGVFHKDGAYYAYSNYCLHAGGP
ncbi:MAG: Rieske (2Fe-2S) protein, partial [Xanthobacteraceae bacterium]